MEKVKPGVQYNPFDVKELNLSNMELPSDCLDLRPFVNCQKLDMSVNELTDLCQMGPLVLA